MIILILIPENFDEIKTIWINTGKGVL
jgi:hypothetical protein